MNTPTELETNEMSNSLLLLMAIAISATAANLYYNQPLLPLMGQSLGLSEGTLGLIPSATQIGYAAAIFFISPLGDIMDRKQLIKYLSISLAVGSLALAFMPSIWMLIVATFIVGLSANITQQILPLASSLTTPEKKGQVIGTLMSGLTIGILLSRTLSGTLAEHLGWRSVFVVAAVIAIVIGVLLQIYLPSRKPAAQLSYPKLLMSMFTLFKSQPLLRDAAITGGLWFAAFNALWATLAIHVSGEPFSYSVQQIGLFGIVGMAGIIGAKISGRLVDSIGPNRIITIALLLIVSGFTVMASWGNTLAGLIVGIILVDIGVFGAQIPNQVRVFSIDLNAQSRMNAVYMLFYYLGASMGSSLGVYVMHAAGWSGLTTLGIGLAAVALGYHIFKSRNQAVINMYKKVMNH